LGAASSGTLVFEGVPGIERVFGVSTLKLWIKCKHASELASRAMDDSLPMPARVALKLHQLVCANCARYARQLQEIRRLLRLAPGADEDRATLSREAVHRIETELHKRLDP
jgi:hypothetical protein